MEKLANGIYKISLGNPEQQTPVRILQPDSRWEAINALSDPALPFQETDILATQRRAGLKLELPLGADEDVYGLGLQLKSFCQSGKKKTLRANSDPAADTGDSHAPVPFYVSTKGYGVLIDTARHVTFCCGNCKQVDGPQDRAGFVSAGTPVGHWEVKAGSGNMLIDIPAAEGVELYLFCGDDLADAVCRYNLFSGGGALPPLWGLGILYRADWMADQEGVLALARQIREDHMPCDIFGLEPGWQTHAYSSSYVWDRERFPDPSAMTAQLKSMGFKPNLWEQPYVHPSSPIFERVKPHAADYYVWDGLVPDFTQEGACVPFEELHAQLAEEGIDGFKLDECDSSDYTSNWGFPDFAAFPSGMDGEQMHAVFGLLFQKTQLRPFERRNRRTYGQVRNSGALAAPYPYVLYSDLYDHTDFIRGMASAACSGLLWSPEVRQTETEEELLRRIEAVILSPQAVINCFMIPSPPWKQYDYEKNCKGEWLEDHQELTRKCKKIFDLRMSLIPHLYTAFNRYHQEGLPPIRPLVMDYPDDPELRTVYDEFMIGEGLLAAPVLHGQGTSRSIYLPKGTWYDFHTGQQTEGGRRFEAEVPLDQIPMFVRNHTLLALALPVEYVDVNTVFHLELRAYGEGDLSCALYADDGITLPDRENEPLTVSVTGSQCRITGKPQARYDIYSFQRIIG